VPSAPTPFINTIRTDGWPSESIVASAIALASLGSLAPASANQPWNRKTGSSAMADA